MQTGLFWEDVGGKGGLDRVRRNHQWDLPPRRCPRAYACLPKDNQALESKELENAQALALGH